VANESEEVEEDLLLDDLVHLSYTCPGLHGKGARMSVKRKTLGALLGPDQPAVRIPLYQRSYCWSAKTTVPAFWHDSEHGSGHSVGKCVYRRSDEGWECLDGQQRVTTISLLVAAARDTIGSLPTVNDEAERTAAIDMCNGYLLRDSEGASETVNRLVEEAGDAWHTGIADGELFPCLRLVPSHPDRKVYTELILEGLHPTARAAGVSDVTRESRQHSTKRYLDTAFRSLAASGSVAAVVSRVREALGMQLMMVELQSPMHVGQVYQWLQEKSILGVASILHNPTPGIDFGASDLARNLFLAPFMSESTALQEKVFQEIWLDWVALPVAKRRLGTLDDIFRLFLASTKASVPLSPAEKQVAQMATIPMFAAKDLSGIKLYGRIVSWWVHEATAGPEATAGWTDSAGRVRARQAQARRMLQELAAHISTLPAPGGR
jgi:hypothetical protein